MKLYTEEQVKEVWKAGQKYWETSGASITLEELLEQLKPIELPSDKEIETRARGYSDYPHGQAGFIRGTKYMKEQILNQNI